jgi:long-chain acyl-CoA synthetase
MIFVSKQQAAKIEEIRNDLPELQFVVYLDGIENPGSQDLIYSNLIEKGKELRKTEAEKLDTIWKNIQPNDVVNISYTSGTTADPKGIMLTQLNYAANVVQSNGLLDLQTEWTTLAILPWDHAFAHTTCLYVFMYKGASVASVEVGNTPLETLKNIPKNIKEIKPTLMMSVPAYSKAFRKNIEAGIKAKGETTYKLFEFALKVAYKYNGTGYDKGKGFRFLLKPLLSVFDKILFSKIRDGFGGKLQFFIGGGALLDSDLQRFFYAIGMPICQGYGLTEASPVISSNTPDCIKFGSSGKPVKMMELKIKDAEGNELKQGEKGEICIKGDNVMLGYWNNPSATTETVKDNWLHTGDMGFIDNDGFLIVLGRFKSLLIGNDGEKYSPEGIEEAMIELCTSIQQVMLHNNQNPYTVGMIVPDIEAINRELKNHGIEKGTESAATEALKIIQADINQFKKGGKHDGMFPERWLPTTVAVLPEAFSAENKMLNAQLKMVRGKINEHYEKELDFLYTPQAKLIENEMNIEALKKWFK